MKARYQCKEIEQMRALVDNFVGDMLSLISESKGELDKDDVEQSLYDLAGRNYILHKKLVDGLELDMEDRLYLSNILENEQ